MHSKIDKIKHDSGGTIAGKTLEEIVSVCGRPSSASPIGADKTLRQWVTVGYQIGLLFDQNDICICVTSEVEA